MGIIVATDNREEDETVLHDHAEALLIKAAEETMKRIREDRARVSRRLKPLIDYIADHLFDVDFQVSRMLAECGVRDHTTPTQFASELRLTPRDYVGDCRLEVAARMLRSSDLYVWRIAMSVGYSGNHAFSRAFKRQYGMGPRVYRTAAKDDVPADTPSSPELLTAAELEEALAGKLDPADAESLDDRLRAIGARLRVLYPNLRQQQMSVRPVVGAEFVEEVMAERLWERIRSLPWNDQRILVKSQFCFSTPALFELLLRKSREEGREDRSCGVQVAQLALDSLDSIAGSLMEFLPNYRAKGLACLSTMYRLALDFTAAERALDCAEKEWQIPQEDVRDQTVLHLIVRKRAGLRLYQRRYEEAYELIIRATDDLADSCTDDVLIESLILRGTIENYTRTPDDTIASLRKAQERIGELGNRHLRLYLFHSLARAYVEKGRYERAKEYIATAIDLAEQCNHRLSRYQLRYIEGRSAAAAGDFVSAEACFISARKGLCDIRALDDAAYVSLALAILYSKQGRHSEVLDLVVEVLSMLEPMGIHEEISVALRILHDAINGATIPLVSLEQGMAIIGKYLKNPTRKIGRVEPADI
ncbi:MAG: helix-turn-helix transcriptional regulator [bacterium]|nr:helix-turn-helix transcriptional regulator [bacterium]